MSRSKKKKANTNLGQVAKNIETTELGDYVLDSYLPYSYYVILNRALVDVSGMKPVQKRIIYSMFENGISAKSKREKVVRLAGAVLKYHPHGDSSVEDALTRMAPPVVTRVPLIDGKGSFGGWGERAAAGRYIEARLSKAAMELVTEVADGAVEMVPNYDDTAMEPQQLPVKWPVSIINGTMGMAVGYASNMVSHNPREVMRACRELVKNPGMRVDTLLKYIQGPDFHQGGVVLDTGGIRDYMATGSGKFLHRGRYNSTPGPRGRTLLEFYELPYGVYAEKVMTELQKLDSPDISDFKNLSDLKHPVRLMIEVKPGVNLDILLALLWKKTSLQSSFSVNMTSIIDNRPVRTGMLDQLLAFLEFRRQCIRNVSRNRMDKLAKRVHVLDGLAKIALDIDKAIKIVRESENAASAKVALSKAFKINDIQAEYVLSLQLRRLTKQDVHEIQAEQKQLTDEITHLKAVLSSDVALNKVLTEQLKETEKSLASFKLQEKDFTTERRTLIHSVDEEKLKKEEKKAKAALIEPTKKGSKKVITKATGYVWMTATGGIQRGEKVTGRKVLHAVDLAASGGEILALTNQGHAFKIQASDVAESEAPIVSVLPGYLGAGERVLAIATGAEEGVLITGTKRGVVKAVKPEYPLTKDTFTFMKLAEDDEILDIKWVADPKEHDVVFISSDASLLTFGAEKVRPQGLTGGGVAGISLKEGCQVVGFNVVSKADKADGGAALYLASDSKARAVKFDEKLFPQKGRATGGYNTYSFTKGESAEIIFAGVGVPGQIYRDGKAIRLPEIQNKRVGSGR